MVARIVLCLLAVASLVSAASIVEDEKIVAKVKSVFSGSDCISRYACPGSKYILLGLRREDFDEFPLPVEKQELLRQAYKSMAMKVHPDKNKSPETHKAFRQVRDTMPR